LQPRRQAEQVSLLTLGLAERPNQGLGLQPHVGIDEQHPGAAHQLLHRLGATVRTLLTNPATTVLVSAATGWELNLKHHQGTLPALKQVIGDLPALLQADGFQSLSIALAHGLRAGAYTQLHRDPFDRLLAAQAELERLVLITADPHLPPFPAAPSGDDNGAEASKPGQPRSIASGRTAVMRHTPSVEELFGLQAVVLGRQLG
jgi:PIN domain nuclease of toxin-antitoxin system